MGIVLEVKYIPPQAVTVPEKYYFSIFKDVSKCRPVFRDKIRKTDPKVKRFKIRKLIRK